MARIQLNRKSAALQRNVPVQVILPVNELGPGGHDWFLGLLHKKL